MSITNPLGLDNAWAFAAWSVSDDGTHVTLYWPGDSIRSRMFYIADQADAVHVLVTRSAEPPAVGEPVQLSGFLLDIPFQRAELWLPSPLGTRQIVDATAGVERPEFASDRDYGQHLREAHEYGRARRPQPKPSRRWTYETDSQHVIPFVKAPGHPDESRRVAFDQFG